MTVALLLLLTALIVVACLLARENDKVIDLRSENAYAWEVSRYDRDMAKAAEDRLLATELTMSTFIVKVAPLIEQTDWMSGRWGGRFDELVELEAVRNLNVWAARKALHEVPVVQDEAKQTQMFQSLPENKMPIDDFWVNANTWEHNGGSNAKNPG